MAPPIVPETPRHEENNESEPISVHDGRDVLTWVERGSVQLAIARSHAALAGAQLRVRYQSIIPLVDELHTDTGTHAHGEAQLMPHSRLSNLSGATGQGAKDRGGCH